ncbi:flagellin N-terminal helical domain-containing protein [Limnohabitans sp.]|uniref:flagellin N-terminal helical domain-containing protein n=1 Tax=Limnohabitans sp. TaxID=1907725 RepID=UPI002FDF072C
MAVINTNVKALFSQMALGSSGRAQSIAMQQLSTGKRINSARDDAAGMSIATRMTHQIRSLNQAVRNAGDAISLMQTAEGATNEITDMMQRMRELAVQAVNDTNNNADRSYLDLEFQQLKQQIVQIADNTEWNGFPVLNGKAGEQVGEMPVYKVTSENQFGDVFITPTTSRTLTGPDAGEVQTFTLSGATPTPGNITIAGVTVAITSSENNLALAVEKIKTTLNNSTTFSSRGMTISEDAGVPGKMYLNFNVADGNVGLATVGVNTAATGLSLSPAGVVVEKEAATQSAEVFANNGKYLQSGSLAFTVAKNAAAASAVTATFTTTDNKKITMMGTVVTQDPAVVKFAKADGLNSSVISGDLTYTMQDATGASLDFATRGVTMSVGVAGSIPTLREGDLTINGVIIGPSQAADDLMSPRNNAAGSAIAKAAAINRMAMDQGISQGEAQSITLSGTPMPGTITVGGVSVVLTNDDNTPALAAAKIAAAMQASPLYDNSTNRSVVYASGSAVIGVNFPAKEGNVTKLEVVPGATGIASVVNTSTEYAVKTPGTGVFAKVNENIMTGQSMVGGPVTKGVVFINGFASADISTIFNNSQATRSNVVRAINLISDRTGVTAIDSGSDTKGISLVAPDGRNIEVRFETSDSSNAMVFGQRVGLREGVQSATISLESKIQAPVVLAASATGDITRAGLVSGNFSKNESILNTRPREPVAASVAQVTSVLLTSDPAVGDTASIVINGTTFTSAAPIAPGKRPQDVAEDLIGKINAQSILGVYATKGKTLGEILLTARTPGESYTLTAEVSSSATISVAATEVTANQVASTKNLGMDDLEINGIKIRPTTANDDKFSNTLVSSSNPSASGLALAAAINASTSLTGVTAEANPALSEGIFTDTGTPISGKQELWVNGTKIEVNFVQNETGTARREKVVDAINERIGQHGVTAKDNGKGVTLSTDGRNLSVWFDSSKDELSAANFGLDKGGAVAQQSRIKVGGDGATPGAKASVFINGVLVETPNLPDGATAVETAAALALAISGTESLKNIKAEVDPSDTASVLITSEVPGTAFDLRGPTVSTAGTQTLNLGTITPNSQGKTDVSAVDMSVPYLTNVLGSATAPVSAMDIKTVYSTVRLTSDAPVLPALPGADGLPPNMMNITGRPIQIRSGADGFGPQSNFSALGFNEGSFGGRASQDMDPPRVGRMAFQVGSSANQVITIDLADFGKGGPITGQITADADLAEDARKVRINTRDGATAVLNMLDSAMDKVNATRATMGAVMNRLDHVINNLTNVSMNMSASRSQIEDADYAKASTELAKTQIMQQAATAVLAQANTSQQSVLKLLGG